MDVIRGCIILVDLFYHQPVYVGDGCVEYECMKLKLDDDVRKIFFIFLKFSSKGLIKLNATFERSSDKTLSCYTNQGKQDLLMRSLL